MEVGPNLVVGDMGQKLERSEEALTHRISCKRLNEVNIKHSFSPGDVVLASSAYTVTPAEVSGPPSPIAGAIPNFGAIDTDKRIYRSSFPHSCNVEHLKSLQLKTVVTLVSTAFEPDVEHWLAASNVQNFRIIIPAHKSSDDRIPMQEIVQVMNLMTDDTKRPLLIHCNKGKHRTGCMTACFRKLHGMNDVHAITEYHEYARPKARAYDVAFISRTNTEEIMSAVFKLQTPTKPVSYESLQPINKRVETGRIDNEGTTGSTTREGSLTADDSEDSGLALHRFSSNQKMTAPDPPLSPPFSSAIDLGFSASDLVEALLKIGDGRDQAALTPPQTPAEDDGSNSACSNGSSCISLR